MKICPSCSLELSLEECFYKSSSSKNGYMSRCKRCTNKRTTARRKARKALKGTRISVAALGGLKVCTKCERPLPLQAYNKNRASNDGLSYHCRSCQNGYAPTGKKDAPPNRTTYLRGHDYTIAVAMDRATLKLRDLHLIEYYQLLGEELKDK